MREWSRKQARHLDVDCQQSNGYAAIQQAVNSQLHGLETRLVNRLVNIDHQLNSGPESIEHRLNSGLKSIEHRLNSRLESIDHHLNSRLGNIERRLDRMEARTSDRLQSIEQLLYKLIDSLHSQRLPGLSALDTKATDRHMATQTKTESLLISLPAKKNQT